VLPVQSWADEKEIIKRANASLMGLGAIVWYKDIQRANRKASQSKAGNFFINRLETLKHTGSFGEFKEVGIAGSK